MIFIRLIIIGVKWSGGLLNKHRKKPDGSENIAKYLKKISLAINNHLHFIVSYFFIHFVSNYTPFKL